MFRLLLSCPIYVDSNWKSYQLPHIHLIPIGLGRTFRPDLITWLVTESFHQPWPSSRHWHWQVGIDYKHIKKKKTKYWKLFLLEERILKSKLILFNQSLIFFFFFFKSKYSPWGRPHLPDINQTSSNECY